MGNPPIHRPGSQLPAGPPTEASNGILAQVGGEHISRGGQQLPKAGPEQQHQLRRQVVLTVPNLGSVRITYQINSYKHRRSKFWHWLAVCAEKVE